MAGPSSQNRATIASGLSWFFSVVGAAASLIQLVGPLRSAFESSIDWERWATGAKLAVRESVTFVEVVSRPLSVLSPVDIPPAVINAAIVYALLVGLSNRVFEMRRTASGVAMTLRQRLMFSLVDFPLLGGAVLYAPFALALYLADYRVFSSSWEAGIAMLIWTVSYVRALSIKSTRDQALEATTAAGISLAVFVVFYFVNFGVNRI